MLHLKPVKSLNSVSTLTVSFSVVVASLVHVTVRKGCFTGAVSRSWTTNCVKGYIASFAKDWSVGFLFFYIFFNI